MKYTVSINTRTNVNDRILMKGVELVILSTVKF